MENISIVIVEDEDIWAKQLEIFVQNLGYHVAGCFNEATKAMVALEKLEFDIALLDIRMHGLNAGIALGKMIKAVNNKPFIFITSGTEKETVTDAVEAGPSAFLIKPVQEASLYAAIYTALSNFKENKAAVLKTNNTVNEESFFVKKGNQFIKLNWSDVEGLMVEGRYTKVCLHHKTETYLISHSLSKTLSNIIPRAMASQFAQVSRFAAVNIQFIKKIDSATTYTVHTHLHEFEITQTYLQELKELLKIA